MTLVSILTCTYDRPEMLERCVASVRGQTRGGWEHLITDDGSASPEQNRLLIELVGDPRVRVRRRPHVNQPARYWNEMVDLARGDYLCFLDDDNEMLLAYVETMAGVLDTRPDVDVVTCGMVLDDGREFRKNLDTVAEIGQQNTVDNGCFMIRREAMERVGYYPLCIRTLEDWALMRRAAAILRMEHLPVCLTRYHEHGRTRSKHIDESGFASDAAWIKAQTWSPTVAVSVVHASEIKEAVRRISWAEPGDDVWVVAGVLAPHQFLVKVRGALPWCVVHAETDFDAVRADFGERVIACDLTGDCETFRTRVARVLNSARSCRYEAVIP